MLFTVFVPIVVSARIAAFCGEQGSHCALFIVIFRGGGFVVLYFPAIRGFVKSFFKRFIALPINHRGGNAGKILCDLPILVYAEIVDLHQCTREI
jgi:hypothetical protein